MNRSRNARLLVFAGSLAILMNGCNSELSFSTFGFVNLSGDDLYVATVAPLTYDPACGNLGANGNEGEAQATSFLELQQIPKKLTITWWVVEASGKKSKEISTDVEVPESVGDDDECNLMFQYNGDGDWTVIDMKATG